MSSHILLLVVAAVLAILMATMWRAILMLLLLGTIGVFFYGMLELAGRIQQ